MVDFAKARRTMVDNQLRTSGITDWRILDVMNRVPREAFVPSAHKQLAYIDDTTPISADRQIAAPAQFARLIQLAAIRDTDVVLDVGCATGYSTAVLAGLANAVVALEEDQDLVERANDTLAALDVSNAAVVSGPLAQGVPNEAPFDVIVVEGAVDQIPDSLAAQLRDGGRLVAVRGLGNAAVAYVTVRQGDTFSTRPEFNASLPPLGAFSAQPAFQF